MSEVKVSVIIPVYNVESFLRECLDSIINQTLKEIEILCINDGATDNSPEILDEYSQKDSRIKVINQVNSGICEARNAGLSIALGEFVGFVDSDDTISPNFYEKLYNSAVNNNADIACASVLRGNKKKQKLLISYNSEKIATTVKDKFELAGVPEHCYVWNKIYKKDSLQKNSIEFKRGIVYEDMLFMPESLEQMGTLVTTPDTVYFYRKHTKSLIKSVSDKARADKIENKKYLLDKCNKYNVYVSKRQSVLTKDEYFLFGLKIMKVYSYRATKEYYLFGLIKIMEMREYV